MPLRVLRSLIYHLTLVVGATQRILRDCSILHGYFNLIQRSSQDIVRHGCDISAMAAVTSSMLLVQGHCLLVTTTKTPSLH